MTVGPKDWRGNDIKVGSCIVYPGRYSSSLWVTEGRVIAILPDQGSGYYWQTRERRPALRVQPLRRSRYSQPEDVSNSKPVKVTVLENVTVVS